MFLLVYAIASTQAQAAPNLTPYQPGGWSDKIVVSKTTGTTVDSEPLNPQDTIYVDWAIINNGTTDISSLFYTQLYLDDVLKGTWYWNPPFQAGAYGPAYDINLGSLSTGYHDIRLKTDSTNVIGESDETDNEYTKTIFIGSGTPDIRIDPASLTYTEAAESPSPSSAPTYNNLKAPVKTKDVKILLKTGHFEPGSMSRNVVASMAKKATLAGKPAHMLVQFEDRLSPDERRELEAAGLKILRYVPNNAYWISVSPDARNAMSKFTQAGGIRWSSPARWVDKLSPSARQGRFPPHARPQKGRVIVNVMAFQDVSSDAFANAIESTGAQIIHWTNDHILKASIEERDLERLSSLDIVEWVEPASGPPTTHNVVSAQRIQVDAVKSAPYSLDGSGVTVGVWDGGPIDSHSDFDTRLTIIDAGTAQDHATHVGGTIAGSGAGNAGATGMAPGAELWSYDWNNPTTEMSTAHDSGVRLANHSWGYVTGWHYEDDTWTDHGSDDFGAYTTNSVAWDSVIHSKDMIVFKSAGNDRNDGPDWPSGPDMDGPYDTIGQIASSKNLITIGATEDDDTMSQFSSWGPVDDGRIKPDLCANGVGLLSTLTGNTYGSYNGTSMATPSATGASALLYQLNTQVTGLDLRADTCKAVLIHGAADMGRTGPDYEFGWGLIDTHKSADLLAAQNYVLGSVPDSGSESYMVSVPASASSLKVTLAWTDPPGSAAASVALVNDLDLVVSSPSSAITRPWILDKNNPSSNATHAVNSIDNVEQVVVDSPESGDWTIDVQGTSVPEGSLQNYTLVCEYLSSVGVPQSFTIHNDGTGTLAVDPIVLESAADWISWSPMGSFEIPAGGSVSVTVTVDMDSAPAGTTTRRLLVTSDDPDESPYPAAVHIVVERLPEVEPVQSVAGTMATGLTAQWNCEEGYTYQLQYNDSLDPETWTNIGPLHTPTTGQTLMSYLDTTTSGMGQRFYRIQKLPVE